MINHLTFIEKNIIVEIIAELKRAEEIHPIYPIDPFRQLAIMQEESGEVAKAVNDYEAGIVDITHVRTEIIQTAAMCVRMLKNLERPEVKEIQPQLHQENSTSSEFDDLPF